MSTNNLSSNALSNELPALATAGNRIVLAESSQPVLLRGVNRSGLEYSEPSPHGFLAAAGITEAEIAEITTGWGSGIIRLPFNQDWVLNGHAGFPASDYLAALDQVIEWASRNRAYTLLDLQWLDAVTTYGHSSDGSANRVAPLPNDDSVRLWSTLAERYRNEPAVLYDLFNEPHDPLPDDISPCRHVGPAQWLPWARRLVDAIRDVHPESVIFVSGVDWGYDLRGIRLDDKNLVYSTHVYPWKQTSWNTAFGEIASDLPVFAAEWGGTDQDLEWGRELASYLKSLGIGWTAWSWSDWPRLVESPRPPCLPTPFGQLVREQLIMSPGFFT